MSAPKLRVTILGSTGSIGVNTLEVIALHPGRFEIFALTANANVEAILAQCVRFKPALAVMGSEIHGRALEQHCAQLGLPTRVIWGSHAIDEVASHEMTDIVMAAIVGAAGLSSCIAAAKAGKRLLLANKEALVVGGELFMEAVALGGATLLPIDSEHSAVFQSLPSDSSLWSTQVDKIILTASGGPFRMRAPASLRDVTPEQACAHPNWVMGRKISVDSATMMNKALEVIEARYLFRLDAEKIEVLIHPQSVIHSMVQFVDHSVIAQLGTPDMRGPIAYGLTWPERVQSGASAIDFSTLAGLTFEKLDAAEHPQRFPGLKLAWQVLNAPFGATAILNAANEVAVAAFLDRKIRFDQIHHVNIGVLESVKCSTPRSLGDLLDLDSRSRRLADDLATSLSR